MSFLHAFKLTIALMFSYSIVKRIWPSFHNTVLGNFILKGLIFTILLYVLAKEYKINRNNVFSSNPISIAMFGVIVLSVTSLFLLSWVVLELETLFSNGVQGYLSSGTEIFLLNTRQTFFLTSLIIAPFCEELFFRRILLNELNLKYGISKSVLFSTFLFSLAHLNLNGSLFSTLFYTISSGVLYSILYTRSNDIKLAIFAHFFWNLLTYIFPLLMFHFGYRIEMLTDLIILCSILIAISILLGLLARHIFVTQDKV